MSGSLSNTLSFAFALSANPPAKFDHCLSSLREFLHMADGLTPDRNPIVQNLNHFDLQVTEYIIVDYSHFSYEAIHMLLDASIRLYKWEKMRLEVEHNILEEKGLKTKGVPHLEMMREGYRNDLKIETDYRSMGSATKGFLGKMRRVFRNRNLPFLTGALVAFEGAAIPEFHILDKIVTHHTHLHGQDTYKGLTRAYIDGHKLFEVGHVNDLIVAAKNYISEDNIKYFVKGYLSVALTLSDWWEGMFRERMVQIISK